MCKHTYHNCMENDKGVSGKNLIAAYLNDIEFVFHNLLEIIV